MPHASSLTSRLATRTRAVARAALSRVRRAGPDGRADELPPPRPLVQLQTTSEPGSRVLEHGFFDRFPAFYDTSETSAAQWRLNLRHKAIFAENRDILEGARVLDIASHDGRWSLAALEAGAAQVVGIEARPELVEAAVSNLQHYGMDPERYRFITGDVFQVLGTDELEVDVVLCLGFLYHTLRYNELMAKIRQCGPTHLLVDTETQLNDGGQAVVRLAVEPITRQGNAVADDFSYGDGMLIGHPSILALRMLGDAYGYDLTGFADWGGLLRDNPTADNVNDYRIGRRVTARYEVRRSSL